MARWSLCWLHLLGACCLVAALCACEAGDDNSAGPAEGEPDSGSGEADVGSEEEAEEEDGSWTQTTDTRTLPVVVTQPDEARDPEALQPEWDEADCPAYECEGNTAPVMGEPVFRVNGAVVEAVDDVRNGDRVEILVPFEDEECNLACGTMSDGYTSTWGGSASAGSLPSNIPCGTGASGAYLALGLDLPVWEHPDPEHAGVRVDHYEYEARLVDICGARSGLVRFEFDVRF